ncbi:uncharacterized protein EI90DRAFT_2591692 [Cantharellus anzutake]|uniref:uncharacterized protein n=1 Tax=Cantharellus anzutake TaxID=1750568 RepID=UPI001908123E|nr:uncharacterized protein EI90DRAFT_2591692 [Cantharellus anzutake]KAF8321028.1 hypothetical protein EI90DRAFT_2591692 [Cantharellus anzutake]
MQTLLTLFHFLSSSTEEYSPCRAYQRSNPQNISEAGIEANLDVQFAGGISMSYLTSVQCRFRVTQSPHGICSDRSTLSSKYSTVHMVAAKIRTGASAMRITGMSPTTFFSLTSEENEGSSSSVDYQLW